MSTDQGFINMGQRIHFEIPFLMNYHRCVTTTVLRSCSARTEDHGFAIVGFLEPSWA